MNSSFRRKNNDSQLSDRSNRGRDAKTRVNFEMSDESDNEESKLTLKITKFSPPTKNQNGKGGIQVSNFDPSPGLPTAGRLKPNINVNDEDEDDEQFFSPIKDDLALNKKLSLTSKESLGTQIRNSLKKQGSIEFNRSLERQTSLTMRKSILKKSVGESGDDSGLLDYEPKHF